jgi:[ribosomal protein S5]-alanine N-acetyltransferase
MNHKLRPWNINDLDSLVLHANNFQIAKFMTDAFPHPYSHEHGRNFIQFANRDSPVHIFAIEINNEAVGGIGIHPQSDIMRKNAELGYWLSEKFWGNGIMTKAINEITDFAFQTFDITRIYARPFGTNFPSQKVLEKCGYTLEARIEKNIFKNNEYDDELIYAKRKSANY